MVIHTHTHTHTNGLQMCWHKDILPSAWAFSSKLRVRKEQPHTSNSLKTGSHSLKSTNTPTLMHGNQCTHTHTCAACIFHYLSPPLEARFPTTALANRHLSLPRSLLEQRWRAQKRADEGGKEMETLMVMFFNWVDLWLAVTIILPFAPAGWGNQAGQLKPEGG